jgi:tetratricopeptide (TPR) repeat protein
LYVVVETSRLYLAIQRAKHSERPAGRARGDAFWLLLRADEEVKAKRFHDGLRSLDNVSALLSAPQSFEVQTARKKSCHLCAISARFSTTFHRVPPRCYLHSCAEVPDNQGRELNTAVSRYSRADLLRILRLVPRQLQTWEKAGLVTTSEEYSFFDLVQIKKVRDLCAQRVRPAVIRQSLEAMQKQVAGMGNPLLEAGAYRSGHRIAFRHQGRLLEPIAGQFMFDFSSEESKVVTSPPRNGPELVVTDVADLFARGIVLEENPSTQSEAITTYLKVLDMDPMHAAAHINLGTLYYNRQEYALAERHYRSAIQIDPRYALAYFDLGNVLDETGRVEEAIDTYKTAIQLAPTYADAHYNIALAYEKMREPRKALQHWRAYVKLDTTGPWTVHAKHQIQRILQSDSLKLVHSRKAN